MKALLYCCLRHLDCINATVVGQYNSDVYAKNAANAEFEYPPQLGADGCHGRPVYLDEIGYERVDCAVYLLLGPSTAL